MNRYNKQYYKPNIDRHCDWRTKTPVQDQSHKALEKKYNDNNYDMNLPIFFDGFLNILKNSNITKLSNNLTVSGTLSIQTKKLKKLPENLVINKNLHFYNDIITEIPPCIRVEGNLDLSWTKIYNVPATAVILGIITWPENRQMVLDWLEINNLEINNLTPNQLIKRKLEIGI